MKIFRKKPDNAHLSFVFAGLFIGLGLGFLYDKILVALLLGLGFGFLLAGITQLIKKNK